MAGLGWYPCGRLKQCFSLPNGYRVFPGGKVQPGRATDHSPPSSVAVMEDYSYNSTHPLGHTGPVTGSLYLYLNFKSHTVSHFHLDHNLKHLLHSYIA